MMKLYNCATHISGWLSSLLSNKIPTAESFNKAAKRTLKRERDSLEREVILSIKTASKKASQAFSIEKGIYAYLPYG